MSTENNIDTIQEGLMERLDREAKEKQFAFPEISKRFKEQLNNIGLKSFFVSYSGSGDSGGIDDIEYTPKSFKNKKILSKDHKHWDNKKMEMVRADKKISLKEFIEEYCYELLEVHHSGWEINAGQRGEITWNSEKNSIEHQYTEFYEESNDFEEDF